MLLFCAISIYAQNEDQVIARKKSTTNFLKSQNISTINVDNISSESIIKIKKSNPNNLIIHVPKKYADKNAANLQGVKLTADQWSGYVYNVVTSEDGKTVSYYVSCNVDPPVGPFFCNSTDISLSRPGICRNFTQYYAVINNNQ